MNSPIHLRTSLAGKMKHRMANLRQSAAHPQPQQQGTSGCATLRLRATLPIQAVPAHALTQSYLPASRVLACLTLRFAALCMQKPRQPATPEDLLSRPIIPFGGSRGCQALRVHNLQLCKAVYSRLRRPRVYIIRVMQATIVRATASLASGHFPLRSSRCHALRNGCSPASSCRLQGVKQASRQSFRATHALAIPVCCIVENIRHTRHVRAQQQKSARTLRSLH